jgi:hypothetical protein
MTFRAYDADVDNDFALQQYLSYTMNIIIKLKESLGWTN